MKNVSTTYRDFAQQVLAAADIVEVVGQYVELKRAGSNLKGLCPFHQEKTPSFNVHPGKQIFKCFSCGKGGDAITFIREIERADFREALEVLARKYGLEMPAFQGRGASDEQLRWRQSLGEALEHAAQYYQSVLAQPQQGAAVRKYLEDRDLRPEMVERFRLGLASDAWDGLIVHLRSRGYSDRAMIETGLARQKKSGQGVIDYLRGRLVFPISNARGKVVAFGGRILEGDDPKYLNTAETALFQKGRELYGLCQARDTLTRQEGPAVLVEGYTDVIACHQAGLVTAVASMGTALTPDQARLIRRYAPEAVFLYDADEAGIKAILRGLEVLVAANLGVRVGLMPPGEDPDSFARAHGAEALRRVIEDAVPFFDFMLGQARSRYDLESPEQSVRVLEVFEPVLSAIGERLVYDGYVQKLAVALGHDEAALRRHLAEHRRRPARRPAGAGPPVSGLDSPGEPPLAPPDDTLFDEYGTPIAPDSYAEMAPSMGAAPLTRREKGLLRILIDHADARVVAREQLDPAWIAEPRVRFWAKWLLELGGEVVEAWPELMRACEGDGEQRTFLESVVFSTDEKLDTGYMVELERTLNLLASGFRKDLNKPLNRRIDEAWKSGGLASIEKLVEEQQRNFTQRIQLRRQATEENPAAGVQY